MSTITTRAGKGSPLTNNEVDANFTNLNTDKAELSGAAFTGAITTNSTIDGRDVATDGTKLDGIEAGATADQTAAEIKTAYESNADTNAFTDADESKLDGIEAGADVTDTANVTAAGALMDSELTAIASVKALNQGVATTDSPTFAGLTTSADISFGDNDKAVFGAGSDLQIYHDGTAGASYIDDVGTGRLYIRGSRVTLQKYTGETMIDAVGDGAVTLYHDNNAPKLATTSTGIDVTGTATMDGLTSTTSSSMTQLTVNGTGAIESGINFANGGTTYGQIYFNNVSPYDMSVLQQYSTGSLIFGTNDTERMRLTSTGLGIGTSSPSSFSDTQLMVRNNLDNAGIGIATGQSGKSARLRFFDNLGNQDATIGIEGTGNALFFTTVGGGESMRIDSSGDLIVGGTSSGANDAVSISNTGYIQAIVNGDTVGYFNRRTSDGEILRFQKDGTTVGSIGSNAAGGTPVLDISANSSSGIMRMLTSGSERMRIDSSGNVGIGTSSPSSIAGFSKVLKLEDAANASYVVSGGVHEADFGISSSGGYLGTATNVPMRFVTNTTERMRIDSSGNLLVGKTTTNIATSGCRLGSFGAILTRGDGAEPLRVNRTGSDGDIIKLDKDGTTVGSIGSTGGNLQFMSGSVGVGVGDDNLYPTNGAGNSTDAALDIGDSGARFKDLYLSGTANVGGVYNTGIYNQQSGDIQFWVPNVGEAVRIQQNTGDLLVGTTSPYNYSGITPLLTIDNHAGIGIRNVGSSDAGYSTIPSANHNYYAGFFLNSSGSGVGNIFCTGSSTAYNTSSDYRLKENIVGMSGATERLKQLKPSRFNFIADADTTVDGFLAHEVQDIVPEAITGTKDAVDADGNPEYQGIDQSKLVPLLVATIQELEARITQLENN